MADYIFSKNDGKLHVRYSDLKQTTAANAETIVKKRYGLIKAYESDILRFGTIRHELWAQECKSTGNLPECFGLQLPVSHVEQEFAIEIFKDVVLHSRPDAVLQEVGMIADFKTMTLKSSGKVKGCASFYKNDRQLDVYALQLAIHGIAIKEVVYLVEVWNKERTVIEGYDMYRRPVTLARLGDARMWLRAKVELLKVAEEVFRERYRYPSLGVAVHN